MIDGSRTQLYISGIIGGTFLNAPMPLFFELAMETICAHLPSLYSHLSSRWALTKASMCRRPEHPGGRGGGAALAAEHCGADRVLIGVVHPGVVLLNRVDGLADGVGHPGVRAAAGCDAGAL